MTFDAHGFVDEEAEAFGEAVVALLGEELQDVVQEFRIGVVGHVVWWLDVFADTPTGNHCGPPSTRFSRAERLHPSGVKTEGRKTIYRSRFTPAFWRSSVLTLRQFGALPTLQRQRFASILRAERS